MENRNSVIIKTSIIGIVANVLLAAFKAFVGIASGSVAIVTDAVNNLSDAASSVITIVGTKLAGKEPDKKHPFGYGRIEYLSAMLISVLVLYAGLTAFVESVKKIINPAVPEYKTASIVIVTAAVIVKIVLGKYVMSVGNKVKSDSLVNSGEDAMLDSFISASTLVAAVIYIYCGLSLEAWLGAIIGIIILKSGFEMLKDTLSRILGERADEELAKDIKAAINSYPDVSGAYDLVLHNYGPDSYNGSVHIEVPDTLTADNLDKLLRKITFDIYKRFDVILTAIGVYSINTKDPEAAAVRENIKSIVMGREHILEMHGFYYDVEEKTIRFDMVISFDAPDRHKLYDEVCEAVKAQYPEFTLQVAMDTDYGEN